jgi:hypothetical protein
MQPQLRAGSNRWANAALAFGVASVVFCLVVPLAVVAIVAGISGVAESVGFEANEGRGRAIAGLVLGVVGLVLGLLVWDFVLSAPYFVGD